MFEWVAMKALLYALASAGLYSLLFYKKSGEELDYVKLLATLILGGLVAIGLLLAGIPIEQEMFYTQMGVYGFLTVTIEAAIKIVCRRFGWLQSI